MYRYNWGGGASLQSGGAWLPLNAGPATIACSHALIVPFI